MADAVSLRTRLMAGSAGVVLFCIHGAYLFWKGEAPGLLWICHAACLLAAAGWFFARPWPVAVALLWLVWGNLMWGFYLVGGGDFYPTSLCTHAGGFILAGAGVYRFGLPRRSWMGAVGGMAAVLCITRLATPAGDNVNLAHRVHDGWEKMFPNHLVYLLLLLGAAGLVFFAAEVLVRFLVGKKTRGV